MLAHQDNKFTLGGSSCFQLDHVVHTSGMYMHAYQLRQRSRNVLDFVGKHFFPGVQSGEIALFKGNIHEIHQDSNT